MSEYNHKIEYMSDEEFRKRLEHKPRKQERNYSAYERLELGDLLCNEGKFEEAFAQYRKAVEMEKRNPGYHTRLGDAYAYSENAIQALNEYKKAIKLSPRRAEPHFSLAELYRRYGKWKAAISEYRKSVKYNPQNPYYRYKLADSLWQIGEQEDAVLQMEIAVQIANSDAFYHFLLADMLWRVGRLSSAINEMQQATIFCPVDAYYCFRLGLLYMLSHNCVEAVLAIRRAIHLEPDQRMFFAVLAEAYENLGDFSLSKKCADIASSMSTFDIASLAVVRSK